MTRDSLTPPTVLHATTLEHYLSEELGIAPEALRLADVDYALIDPRHMLNAHYDYVAETLRSRGLSDWSEDWDCDDFAMLFVLEARIAHRAANRAGGRTTAQAPAVFECWVKDLLHAIVLCFCNDGAGRPQPLFIEPQPAAPSRAIRLTPGQIRSIALIK